MDDDGLLASVLRKLISDPRFGYVALEHGGLAVDHSVGVTDEEAAAVQRTLDQADASDEAEEVPRSIAAHSAVREARGW